MARVADAMVEELRAMERIPVWERIDRQDVDDGVKIIPTKWVLVNKGDKDRVDIRARLVACEVKGTSEGEPGLFAATPPLEALMCLVSLATTNKDKVLDFIDVRKAHLNGLARRDFGGKAS